MQKHNTKHRIAAIAQRTQDRADELMHLEEMTEQTGGSDFIDEKRAHRAISRAGFATSWH